MQQRNLDLLAVMCLEFIGNGNAPQINDWLEEAGWTKADLDAALKDLGSATGLDLGWS